jgi:demethylmenaquinone methyltransferase/2-methoxy-6-polyprenyl-1,4-benzoquinol methylase
MSVEDRVLEAQLRYYRDRAPEYDQWFLRQGRYDRGSEENRLWFAEVEELRAALHAASPGGDILELACGTGIWTAELLPFARRLTALDASQEMIELNRGRPGHEAVRFLTADLFAWRPERTYDFLFFGFWLSHVPPDRFEAFWELVESCLAPEGRVFWIDSRRNPSSTARDHELSLPGASTLTRKLNDGREFEIVKVFYEPRSLEKRLAALGWSFEIHATESFFLHGLGSRARQARAV